MSDVNVFFTDQSEGFREYRNAALQRPHDFSRLSILGHLHLNEDIFFMHRRGLMARVWVAMTIGNDIIQRDWAWVHGLTKNGSHYYVQFDNGQTKMVRDTEVFTISRAIQLGVPFIINDRVVAMIEQKFETFVLRMEEERDMEERGEIAPLDWDALFMYF
jgi:hypothetical protein